MLVGCTVSFRQKFVQDVNLFLGMLVLKNSILFAVLIVNDLPVGETANHR